MGSKRWVNPANYSYLSERIEEEEEEKIKGE